MADDARGHLVNLLWTGGWDSTFRLLTLLADHPCCVQPYYVTSPDRPGWRIEAARIEKIWSICEVHRPGRVRTPVIVWKLDIESDPEITEQFRRLSPGLGPQYEWLACFAKQYELEDLELGLVRRPGRVHDALWPHVQLEQVPLRRYRLRPGAPREVALFSRFRFPLLGMTKKDIEASARARGWLETMELCWFCHRPFAGRWPCGLCNPCQHTIEDGLGRRVGWLGLLCHHTLLPIARAAPPSFRRLGGRAYHRLTGGP